MHGEGIATVDGKIFMVPNALIGEKVDAEIVEDKGNYAIARLEKIIQPSQCRVSPKCPYFNECGGCQLQHMDYSEQLLFKKNLVKKTIKKILGIDINVNNTVASKQYEYRNKASFAQKDEYIGYFIKNSNEVLSIENCPIQSKEINEIYLDVKNFINENHLNNIVRYIVIRSISGQSLIGLVVNKFCDLTTLYNTLSSKLHNVGLYVIINTRKDSVVIAGKVLHIGGIKEIQIENFGLNYSVDLIGFHQTNIEIQNKLYEKVLSYIEPNSVVLNGFSGAGLLSAILSKRAKFVYGIEINSSAHASAEKLKFDNKIKNLSNILGDFYKKYNTIREKFDTIVLDPTKKGCGAKVMQTISGVKNIIYISCNPIALCKDLREILDNYIIEEITPFDMFPNTENVETLVKLKRR